MDRTVEDTVEIDRDEDKAKTREIKSAQKQALTIAPPAPKSLAILPKNYKQVKEMATDIFESDMAPDSYKSAAQVAIGIQKGLEINLPPVTALQYIAVINGRPYLWGDGTVALVRASGKAKYVKMYWEPESESGVCVSHRKGEPDPQEYRFSMEDAKKANLTGKSGPWKQYPKRMCMWRAAAWLFRDVYADVLLGISVAEELDGYPGLEMVETRPGQFELKSQEGVTVTNPLDDPEPEETPHDPETGEIIDAEFEDTTDQAEDGEDDDGGSFGASDDEDEEQGDFLDPDNQVLEDLRAAFDGCTSQDEIDKVTEEFIPEIDNMPKDKISRANKMQREAEDRVKMPKRRARK